MPDAPQIEHEFVNANGLRFHVATCGEGERLALCLHGFPESWYSWRHQLPQLAQLGYRAWAPDLRGYGQSERPTQCEDYAIERLLDDVSDSHEPVQITARTTIDRRQFGMTAYSMVVGKNVTITINARMVPGSSGQT